MSADHHPIAGVHYFSSTGQEARACFIEGCGLGITRLALSTAMCKRADEIPGLHIRQGVPVVPLRREEGQIWLRAGEATLVTRLLVGADGVNSNARDWAGLFPALLRYFPALEGRLKGSFPVGVAKAVGPLQREALAAAGDNVILIGDAAGYLDAITGEGFGLALAQAHCLDKTVAPLLKSSGSHQPLPLTREALKARMPWLSGGLRSRTYGRLG